MITIGDRIKAVRKQKGYTQQQLGDAIGVKQNTIAQYEINRNIPNGAAILAICKEFGVDRIWLETGVGEPFKPVDRSEQITAILNHAIKHNDTARDRLIRAFSQLPDEMYGQAEKILEEIVANLQKEKE